MCALSSVARLSVSMTMSMSSGLFSMAEDDSDKDKDDAKDPHHHHARGGGESLHTDGSSTPSSSHSGRRHSAPKVLTPVANMSDIEEESLTSQHSHLSQRADGGISPTSSDGSRGRRSSSGASSSGFWGRSGGAGGSGTGGSAGGKKHKGRPGSPKNTSGVRIIINRGSGSDEESLDLDSCSARDTLLDVTDAEDFEDDCRQRRISQFSEVHLLP